MSFPLWAKVLLWLEVPLVFLLNIWYTPYAILVAWGVPILWDRLMRHFEVLEEFFGLPAPKETGEAAEREKVE